MCKIKGLKNHLAEKQGDFCFALISTKIQNFQNKMQKVFFRPAGCISYTPKGEKGLK